MRGLREFWEGFTQVVPIGRHDARTLGEVVGIAVIIVGLVAFVGAIGVFVRWMAS